MPERPVFEFLDVFKQIEVRAKPQADEILGDLFLSRRRTHSGGIDHLEKFSAAIKSAVLLGLAPKQVGNETNGLEVGELQLQKNIAARQGKIVGQPESIPRNIT